MIRTNNNRKCLYFLHFLLIIFSYDDGDEATCSDGIQNGGETGIDCGAPADPMATIDPNQYPECAEKILEFIYKRLGY